MFVNSLNNCGWWHRLRSDGSQLLAFSRGWTLIFIVLSSRKSFRSYSNLRTILILYFHLRVFKHCLTFGQIGLRWVSVTEHEVSAITALCSESCLSVCLPGHLYLLYDATRCHILWPPTLERKLRRLSLNGTWTLMQLCVFLSSISTFYYGIVKINYRYVVRRNG